MPICPKCFLRMQLSESSNPGVVRYTCMKCDYFIEESKPDCFPGDTKYAEDIESGKE